MRRRFARPGLKALLLAGAALLGSHAALAERIALPQGLVVDPPFAIDVTFQILPGADPKQPVLVGRFNGELAYVLSVEKLGPQWTDANKYFNGLLASMRASGKRFEVKPIGSYTTQHKLKGGIVELRYPAETGGAEGTVQQLHFITDGTTSFFIIASPSGPSDEVVNRALRETVLILGTATVGTAGAPPPITPPVPAPAPPAEPPSTTN